MRILFVHKIVILYIFKSTSNDVFDNFIILQYINNMNY